jgi:hypothetical protein
MYPSMCCNSLLVIYQSTGFLTPCLENDELTLDMIPDRASSVHTKVGSTRSSKLRRTGEAAP